VKRARVGAFPTTPAAAAEGVGFRFGRSARLNPTYGLRLGEAEELRLEDLDLPERRLTVRQGKGRKDRTVYLTATAVRALQGYLALRGMGPSSHVLLYHNKPVCKDLIRSRIKMAGERVGVKVSPHRLRHTYATLLLNAGAPILTVQTILGHKHIDTTLAYARLYDGTVAADYYRAMAQVEARMKLAENTDDVPPTGGYLLALVDALQDGTLNEAQRETVHALRLGILALTGEECC